ncbi:MAG TPA: phosphatidylinositol-specific phospholipase C1-like protein [Vicinamibacterales bacterium]|jgi:hypothetical protein
MNLKQRSTCAATCLLMVLYSSDVNPHAAAQTNCSAITAANIADCVRLNQIQMLGTHNSYHIAGQPAMLESIGARARDIEYTHRPLVEQFSQLGIRQIELDVFADPEGGRFASPAARRTIKGLDAPGPELLKPGFKVLHMQDIDYRSTCTTLVACLSATSDWSRSNPGHVPILILIEAKDSPIDDPNNAGYVKPLPIDGAAFRALEREILSVFSADRIVTPDRVRGRHATLASALQADGWPTLRAVRGKVLFALDNTDDHRTEYLRGNPSLEGRVMFVSGSPGEASAAFVKMNEALGDDENRIRETVKSGYLVRTRADIPTVEARTGSTLRRDAAFRSGAQYVSTDYPEPSPFGSGYLARLPEAERLPARCNPVTAPVGCRSEWLEPAQAAEPVPPTIAEPTSRPSSTAQ